MAWGKDLTEVCVRSLVSSMLTKATVYLEIEGFFNLLFSHLISLYALENDVLSNAVSKLLNVIIQQTTTEQTSVKYRVYVNSELV